MKATLSAPAGSCCRRRLPLLLTALGFALGLAAGPVQAGPPAGLMPFAAHNAYPYKGKGTEKLARALRAGFAHIETDLTYDPVRKAVVVTHDANPSGNEPELDSFLAPLWRQWTASPVAGRTLTFDFKSSRAGLVEGLHAVLRKHARALSWMDARAGATFHPGPITVCLSGDAAAKEAYARLAARQGRYLAFLDQVYNENAWKSDAAAYVPVAPASLQRFLTLHSHNFLGERRRGGAIGGAWENTKDFARGLAFWERQPDPDQTLSPARLSAAAKAAARRGYAIRIYVVNSSRDWEACAAAGIPMLATDEYEDAARWWRERR
jgi:hypothetical protein